jgi:hypothetical protein
MCPAFHPTHLERTVSELSEPQERLPTRFHVDYSAHDLDYSAHDLDYSAHESQTAAGCGTNHLTLQTFNLTSAENFALLA